MYVFIGASFLLLACLLLASIWPEVFKFDSVGAAWVQAIGSLISIAVAWNLARGQSVKAENEARRAVRSKCAAVAGIIKHALHVVENPYVGDKGYLIPQSMREKISNSMEVLHGVNVLDLPDPDLVSAIFESRLALQRLDMKLIDFGTSRIHIFTYKRGVLVECKKALSDQIEKCELAGTKFI